MPNAMDREFVDDPFRKMERRKQRQACGRSEFDDRTGEIEEPISARR